MRNVSPNVGRCLIKPPVLTRRALDAPPGPPRSGPGRRMAEVGRVSVAAVPNTHTGADPSERPRGQRAGMA
jgi:hypothetical protein